MEKILVPVDGSPTSEYASEKAIDVAKRYGSKITFLMVANSPNMLVTGGIATGAFENSQEYVEELKDMHIRIMEEQTKRMEHFISKLDLEGMEYDSKVLLGEAYEEIIRLAEEEDFDLIVIGRRGFSKIKSFFLGSVSKRVLSGSPCPVLVINERNI